MSAGHHWQKGLKYTSDCHFSFSELTNIYQ